MNTAQSLHEQEPSSEDAAAQALAACYRLLIEAAKASERRRRALQEIESTDEPAAESYVKANGCELGSSCQVQPSDEPAMAR